jgi:hypothetical protein
LYVDKYDPRMPHPRKIISRNYHHIANHPIVSKLFPRENSIASCKRLLNLVEMLSPTIQKSMPGGYSQDPGVGSGGNMGGTILDRIRVLIIVRNAVPKTILERVLFLEKSPNFSLP